MRGSLRKGVKGRRIYQATSRRREVGLMAAVNSLAVPGTGLR